MLKSCRYPGGSDIGQEAEQNLTKTVKVLEQRSEANVTVMYH